MLSTSIIRSVSYFLNLAREDYYLRGGEPKGRWIGGAAEHFGLENSLVRNRALKQLMQGFSPVTKGEKLVQNAGAAKRQKGFDLTFSAPKDVSLLFAVSSPEMRKKISKAQQEAVKAAIEYLEENAVFSRRGKDGTRTEPGKLLVATFEHSTSRAQDVQLHTHALIANAVLRADKTTGTLHSEVVRDSEGKVVERYNPLLAHIKSAGAMYRTELAFQLVKRLGVEISEQDEVGFGIRGVPKKAAEFASKRRAEIEAEVKRVGVHTSKSAQIATLATRQKKAEVNRPELFEKWQRELARFGLTERTVEQLCGRSLHSSKSATLDTAIAVAMKALGEEQSSFTEKDLVARVASRTEHHAVPARDVTRRIRKEMSQGELVSLRIDRSERVMSTKTVLKLEEQFVEALVRAKQCRRHSISKTVVDKAVRKVNATNKHPLSKEQVESLRYIVTGKDKLGEDVGSVRVICGDAGTGKTTMLKAAKVAFEKSGYAVRGAALAGVASDKLEQESGIESSTVKKWVYEAEKNHIAATAKHTVRQLGRAGLKKHTWQQANGHVLTEKTVLFVDEAAMADSSLLYSLQVHARKAGALVVWVGDEKQLQSINHGGAFLQAQRINGFERLTEVFRQKDPADKEVSELAAKGEFGAALRNLASRGRVHVENTKEEAMDRLVRDWAKAGGAVDPKSHQVFVGTNKERIAMNEKLQRARLRGVKGRLGIGITNFEGQKLYVGSRVNIRENIFFFQRTIGVAKKLGQALNNALGGKQFGTNERIRRGSFGTVLSINPLRGTIRLAMDDKRVLDVPLKMTPKGRRLFPTPKHLQMKKKTPIALALATTTHLAQGGSYPHTYSLFGDMQNSSLSYVQFSRHEETMNGYGVSEEAGKELTLMSRARELKQRGQLEELKEVERQLVRISQRDSIENSELARRMSRSKQKEFALSELGIGK